jgi:hypothetical protein
MENLFNFFDIQFITVEVVKALITLSVPLVLGGLYWLRMLGTQSSSIKSLLKNRELILYYSGDKSEQNKTITFLSNGYIGDGKNQNENYWKVSFGTLKILSSNRKLFSKFRWDKEKGQLMHVNDPRLPSVMGQFIVPFVTKN